MAIPTLAEQERERMMRRHERMRRMREAIDNRFPEVCSKLDREKSEKDGEHSLAKVINLNYSENKRWRVVAATWYANHWREGEDDGKRWAGWTGCSQYSELYYMEKGTGDIKSQIHTSSIIDGNGRQVFDADKLSYEWLRPLGPEPGDNTLYLHGDTAKVTWSDLCTFHNVYEVTLGEEDVRG